MTPYFDGDGVRLFLGDSRDLLPALASFDLAVCDPPYAQTSLDWDHWIEGWPALIPAPQIWCFGSFRMFLDRRSEFASWNFAQEIIWEKHNGSGFQPDRFRRVHEIVAHFYRGSWDELYKKPLFTLDAKARTVGRKQHPPHMGVSRAHETYTSFDGGPRLMRSVIPVRSEHSRAEHPTQKPVEIIKHLVEYSCPPGGRLLDPFAGSGTALLAARDLGMSAVGIEINERYCEIAARRLSQRSLFAAEGAP